jgi:polysaccharide biosynthesis transport protein
MVNMTDSGGMSGFDIKKYWGLVLKRKTLFFIVALAVLTLATVAAYLSPKVYETSCTVFVEQNTMIDPMLRSGATSATEAQLRTLTERIKSAKFLERVLDKTGQAANKSKRQLEWAVNGLQANVTVTIKGGDRRADLFVIAYRGANPTLVRDTVNAIVSEYIAENIEARKSEAAGAYEVLQKQLAEYKAKIDATDAQIASYNARSQRTAPEVTGPSYASRMSALNSKLATLMSQYTENHPEVLKVKSEIENLKKEPQAKRSSGGSSGVSRDEGTRLQADRASYHRTYTELQQKIESARFSKESEYSNILKVIDPAPLPTSPIKPKRVLFILAGIMFGIAAGAGAVFAIDFLNPSFKDEESVEATLKLPVLVSIPSVVTEGDILKAKKHDRKVFIAAAAYFSIFILLLAREILGGRLGF